MKTLLPLVMLFGLSITSSAQDYIFMKMGCRQGTALGCYNYARALFRKGDKSEAAKFLSRACTLGHNRSCEGPKILELDAPKAFIDPEELAQRKAMQNRKNSEKKYSAACDDLPLRISQCSRYSCKSPHLIIDDFNVEYKVIGFDGEECQYEESLPNEGLLKCRFKKPILVKFSNASPGLYGLNSVLGNLKEDPSVCRTTYAVKK